MGKRASHTERKKPNPVKVGGETAGGTLVRSGRKTAPPTEESKRGVGRGKPHWWPSEHNHGPRPAGGRGKGGEGTGLQSKVRRRNSHSPTRLENGKMESESKHTQTNFICSLRINIVPLFALKYLLLELP